SAGVRTLTLYAIGTNDHATNDHTTDPEIDANLRILSAYLQGNSRYCERESIRVSVVGQCPRPGARLLRTIGPPPEPASGARLHLRIVVDYSAHDSVVQSTWCSPGPRAPETFARRLREIDDTALPAGAVDLLIRTGAGRCLSDYLLWEVAYARLHFADCLWPDFSTREFQRALAFYRGCEASTVRIS
ncbi:MAG TPA: undecaprenyl diphosphate synthase family protein, partial [Steroidobacteraceae bacterium]|nr:undecaprenyl diphosphate synthase family protein [Steroidobacteraceae bacterium]